MYIVWFEPFTNYSKSQGDGYFVSYKSKSSDYYSKNWFDAKKYKTIGTALTRLGLIVPKLLTSFDKFLEVNEIDTLSVNRDKLLADILSEKQEVKLGNFSKGRIDKVDKYGTLCSADEDIIEYVNKIIENNLKKNNLKKKMSNFYATDVYEQPKQTSVDTWEGFY